MYSMDSELRFVEYTYLKEIDRPGLQPRHLLRTAGSVELEVNNHDFNQMSLSSIDILSQIEEKLRFKIEYIHDLMRKHKIKFNPLDTADIIYVVATPSRVYQYTMDGFYLDSFPSTLAANAALGRSTTGSGQIGACLTGKRRHTAGYRWSYEKVNKLPAMAPRKTRKDKK